jgi:hypothetical protein
MDLFRLFKGSHLSITDEINIRIDQIDHSCRTYNLTDRNLQCRLTDVTSRKIEQAPATVEVNTRALCSSS